MSFLEYRPTHLFIWSKRTVFHTNWIKKLKPFTKYYCVVTSWIGSKYGNKNIVYVRTRYPWYPKSTGCTYFEWIEYRPYIKVLLYTRISTNQRIKICYGFMGSENVFPLFEKGYISFERSTYQTNFTRRKGDISDQNSDLSNFTRCPTSTGCHLRHASKLHYCFSFILGTFKYDINPKGLSIKQF